MQIIVGIIVGLVVVFATLLGAVLYPQSFMNAIVCGVIDGIAAILPSTPPELKVAHFIDSVSALVPVVGRDVIADTFGVIISITTISLVIKIYKLLPFKMS